MKGDRASLTLARKAIREAKLYCFCDKLKSGGYSVKLHDGNYDPVSDALIPELVKTLSELASDVIRVPFTVPGFTWEAPRQRVAGESSSRFRFRNVEYKEKK